MGWIANNWIWILIVIVFIIIASTEFLVLHFKFKKADEKFYNKQNSKCNKCGKSITKYKGGNDEKER